MKWFVATVSAVALAASGAAAQGNGNGNGKGNGGAPAQAGGAKADRGNGNDNPNRKAAQRSGNDRASPQMARSNNGNSNGNANSKAANGNRADTPVLRGNGNAGNGNNNRNDNGARAFAGAGNDRIRTGRDGFDPRVSVRFDDRRGYYGVIDGCPPGLAKKNNGCNPPGQLKDRRYSNDWWGMSWLGNERYYYDDGYLVRRLSDGRIGGYLPLLGGALSIGRAWPSAYAYEPMSPYRVNYYGLGPANSYRYADNVVYRVDPETAAITSIAALLTGDDFTVGSRMPRGYDVYNVPYGYRDRYYDRPDAMYRYSDGYVYQIDPETRLVAAAIELIAS